MFVTLPRNVRIDLDNIPEDFEELIKQTFHDYTKGTREEYRYQDKLCFIDRCVELLHRNDDGIDAVKQMILERTEYSIDEYGELPDKEELWSLGFMGDCYNQGKKDSQMYSKTYYSEDWCMKVHDKHLNDKVMKLLERIIKVVINYED